MQGLVSFVSTRQWSLLTLRSYRLLSAPQLATPTPHPAPHPPLQASCGHKQYSSRAAKRMIKLGIGPDGKPLPQANGKKVFPRMYQVLLVNQDGSTYTIRHGSPLQILTLPLDPSTLSEEEQRERERRRQAAKERVYVEEEDLDEESWDQSQYRGLIDKT